jgi:hypothetical protein
MMIAYELDRKLRDSKRQITVNSWSPGLVPTTAAGHVNRSRKGKHEWMARRRSTHLQGLP